MPYITADQRYHKPKHVPAGNEFANIGPARQSLKQGSNTGDSMNFTQASPPSPSQSKNGFRGGGATYWQASRPQSAFGEYVQQAQPGGYSFGANQTYGEGWRSQAGFDNREERQQQYGGSNTNFRYGYPGWQQPPASYPQSLYPAAPAQNAFYQPFYQGQQQYASYSFPQYQQYAPFFDSTAQAWLTQRWQPVNNVQAPPQPYAGLGQPFNPNASVFRPSQSLKYKQSKPQAPLTHELEEGEIPPPPPTDSYGNSAAPWFDPHAATARRNPPRQARNAVDYQTPEFDQTQAGLQPFNLPIRTPPCHQDPIKYMLPRPEPSPAYLEQAYRESQTRILEQRLLVILDLNGTLLYRKNRGSNFVGRPKVREFLHHLFENHFVMVSSSAKPQNVEPMCDKLFTKEQKAQLVAVWARDKLRLPSHAYNQRVQVYKQLSWVWSDKSIQSRHSDSQGCWDQSNTVLIDDSYEKAASEPYNIIELEEFEGKKEQMEADVLGQVTKYLKELCKQQDVSAYMRRKPFEYVPENELE